MRLDRILRVLFAALSFVLLVACGAHDVADEEAGAFSDISLDALTNCDPKGAAVFLELRDYGAGKSSALYEDVDLVVAGRELAAGAVVRHDPGDVRMSGARARRNDALVVTLASGHEGWLPVASVRVRAPASGQCSNGADPTTRASAALRIASAEHSLPLDLARGAVACGLGLGEGAFNGGRELIELVAKVLAVTPDLARELFALDKDIFFAALGRADAAARLHDRAVSAKARLESVAAALLHAIPTIQKSLHERYAYYQMLDAENQSRMLCGIIGRLSFEVLLGLGVSSVAKEAPMLIGRVIAAHAEATRAAALPGRSGGLVNLKILASVANDQERAARWGVRWSDRVRAERQQQATWMATVDGDLRTVANRSASADERLAAMDRISRASNPPERIAGAGPFPNDRGNCAFAALTLLATAATGQPQCALPYLDDTHFSNGMYRELDTWKMPEPTFGNASEVATAAAALEEGELAMLFSRAWLGEVEQSAHATVLVKLEGRVYNVNNQGWFPYESVEGWTQRWTQRGFSRVAFGLTRGTARIATAVP